MRTLYVFLGVGVSLVLSALTNVATADVKNESILQGLTFVVDPGDGSVSMPDISFDTVVDDGAEEAQATCAMTPGGSTANFMLEESLVQQVPARAQSSNPNTDLSPISSLNTPPSTGSGGTGGYYPPYRNPGGDPGGDPGPGPSIVPEPGTMLMVGLGLGAAAFASRRRRIVRQ